MKQKLRIAYIWIAGIAILSGIVALTLANPHFYPVKMSVLMKTGKLAMAGEDYDTAADYFLLAIRLNPKKVDAYLLLADAFVAMGGGDPSSDWVEDAIYYLKKGYERTENEKLQTRYLALMSHVPLPSPTEPPAPEPSPYIGPDERHYTIGRHDTLESISLGAYGSEEMAGAIYARNKNRIADRYDLEPGQVIVLPKDTRPTPTPEPEVEDIPLPPPSGNDAVPTGEEPSPSGAPDPTGEEPPPSGGEEPNMG